VLAEQGDNQVVLCGSSPFELVVRGMSDLDARGRLEAAHVLRTSANIVRRP
jgi:hypothetical protein